MNAIDLINALELPVNARVNRRIPKKLLLDNGTPTPADVRQINEEIEELHWLAALKPTNIGIAAYRDDTREILEIAVLHLVLRSGAKPARLSELIHRAIPYPVVLIIEQETRLTLSLADKRWSNGNANKIVLEGELIEARLDDEINKNFLESFLKSLTLARQSGKSLFRLYEGWIDIVLTLQTSHFTGTFTRPTSAEHATTRREALQTCNCLKSQMESLRTAAAKETQLSRQVELNLKSEKLKADYAATCAKL